MAWQNASGGGILRVISIVWGSKKGMKINNKGYASTIIMFSILTLFLISMLMLVKTMNNSSSLNKKITEKVVISQLPYLLLIYQVCQ